MEQKINVNPEEIQNIVISESTPQTIKLKNLSLETVNINQNENQQININEEKNQLIYVNDENTPPLVTDVLVNGDSVVRDSIAYVVVPTKTSDLNNDSNFVKLNELSLVAISGNYSDLNGKPTIPTSTSELVNDSGFITDSYHDNTKQDTLVSGTNIKTINNTSLLGSGNISISGGSATDVQINGTSITSSNVANIITESAYDDTTNKIATMSDIPSVPTKTSELNNDSGFITSSDLPQDSGWKEATLTSDFVAYNSTFVNQYRKIGKIVFVEGGVKPTAQITANSETTIFTLPSGYRPSKQIIIICQGSGMNRWCLTVNTNGNVTIQRYGTTSNIAIPTNAWLPFSVTFAID